MKKFMVIFLVLTVLIGLYVVFLRPTNRSPQDQNNEADEATTTDEVAGVRTQAFYTCAGDKRFMVAKQGMDAKLALDDGRFVAISRVQGIGEVEGDTLEYKSADAKVRLFLVLPDFAWPWRASVVENGKETYAECTALAEGNAALETAIEKGASGAGLRIEPLEVFEDSRCAIDVVCIQAGTIRLRALVSSDTQDPAEAYERIFELGVATTTGPIKITLSTVLPAPQSTVEIEPEAYRFYFSIVQ